MVCQDWGGLMGLRMLAEGPERLARLVAMNTGVAVGDPPGEAFLKWRRFAHRVEALNMPH